MASSREAMGREEPPPSKKRVALRQISKDDDPESEEEEDGGDAGAGGTFRRATDQVLAERRIVKVRRTPAAPAAGPNPFATICLVAPSTLVSRDAPVAPPEIATNSNSADLKSVVGDGSPATTGIPRQASMDGDRAESLQTGDVTELKNIGAGISQQGESITVAPQVQGAEGSLAEFKKPELMGEVKSVINSVAVTGNSILNGDEDNKARGSELVGPSGTSSETFQQLSSAKNAFAGSFGTGFSSSPSIVTSSSTVPSQVSFGKPFTFGSQPFGSSVSLGVQTPFGSISGLQGGFPSVSSVFGKTNGSGSSPLFGSLAPSAAAPTLVAAKSSVVSLQEIHVETGEEKEKAVFTADAALFEFLDGGWKERGKGELKLNVSEEKDKRPRLVMRSKGNYRLLLNASLFPDMKLSKMDNRGISFVCANSAAEGKTGLATYAVKLKDGFVESEFTTTVQAHKGSTNSEPRTPESSPKATERPSKVVETSEIEA